ncbi:putative sphingolipid C4-monooxygenase [Helianthus annuus]|uniref:Sphingolipid C4-monooxygenase n=1 Tax=Helianthus annuus TaxID=4232 RepID=A0A9K3I4E9_HELAN|nr:putative sphingolipid C4-monooxygenase [Helianthus annuus]KAJ0525349.1 putative sphingolipid C4-monooxygenase [Helianthus annuus]KAJ0710833.1 putative sphingolipid C4-monooxygenase [Helianthus annuus]KAJ0892390.1 putative sphingolipid C4-monooxygenase [Helianthus annuus]
MEVKISGEFMGTVAPLVVYWIYSGFYVLFGSSEKYRLHSKKEEDDKNLVSKKTVVKGVLLQQAIQAVVAIILFTIIYFFWNCLLDFVLEIRAFIVRYTDKKSIRDRDLMLFCVS